MERPLEEANASRIPRCFRLSSTPGISLRNTLAKSIEA